MERNSSFNLDRPGLKNEPTGFSVSFVSEHGSDNFQAVGGGKQTPWTGNRQPYFHDCVEALESSNAEYVHLESSGQWLCAETATNLIVRLRFDGNSGESFRFFVTVYRPPQ